MACIHQKRRSEKRTQASSRSVIQKPVRPASSVDTRACMANLRSIASNSATRAAGAAKLRTAGSSTRVTKATPPIQCTIATTCSARARVTSSMRRVCGCWGSLAERGVCARRAIAGQAVSR
jgi:hypothetical protein